MGFSLAANIYQQVLVRAGSMNSLLYDGTGPGIFGPIMDRITLLARDLWGVLVGLIIIAATLAMIISVLRGTGGMLVGGSKETTVAVVSIVGVVLLVVVAFVAIPQLANLLKSLQPAAPF
jgi:hypothetical protein